MRGLRAGSWSTWYAVDMSSNTRKRRAHFDPSGHVQPKYEAQQHARSADPDPRGFLRDDTHDPDSHSLQSGEQFVESVTSAANSPQDAADEVTSEELGGPFVETDAATELSKIAAAEALPETPDRRVSKT